MNNKEALETISQALAIANAKCRELQAAKEQLQATNDRLLAALETANRTIQELTRKERFTLFEAKHRTGTETSQSQPARIIHLTPAANDQ
ncbi:MAG: hypothetical protein IJ553_05255 [Alloprevotella sp.]|nr:hypothetical protein [Prevotella sp.]MBR1387791.1 hypothetical protein [Alloprevotella sp.]